MIATANLQRQRQKQELEIQEIRLLRQQTELLRQPTEALRQQNQQMKPQPAAGFTPSTGPYLGNAMVTMPKPTGNTKRDRRAWAKWLAKLDLLIQESIPSWNPEAYEQVQDGDGSGDQSRGELN